MAPLVNSSGSKVVSLYSYGLHSTGALHLCDVARQRRKCSNKYESFGQPGSAPPI